MIPTFDIAICNIKDFPISALARLSSHQGISLALRASENPNGPPFHSQSSTVNFP